MSLIPLPTQQVQQAQPGSPYGFERLEGEADEEYGAFLDFCEGDDDLPRALVAKMNLDPTLPDRFYWLQRRDAFALWHMSRVRMRSVRMMDRVLSDIEERRPYLLRRIKFQQTIERIQEVDPDDDDQIREEVVETTSKLKPQMKQGLTRALAAHRDDANLAIKILYALSSGGGIVINNVAATLNAPASSDSPVERVAKEWGHPTGSR